jgi:hypothetical protein
MRDIYIEKQYYHHECIPVRRICDCDCSISIHYISLSTPCTPFTTTTYHYMTVAGGGRGGGSMAVV